MKTLLLFLWLTVCSSLFALPLSPDGRKERDAWMEFLSVVYDQRAGDKKTLSRLEKLAAANPESAYLKRLVVAEAVAQDLPDRAAPYVGFIEQENPSVDDYIVYGMYLASKEDLEGASDAYEKALSLDFENDELLTSYVAIVEGFPVDEAAEKINRLAEKYPSLAPDFDAEIGRLYLQNNRLDTALSYANKSLSRQAQHPRALLVRAGVYEKQQNYFLMLHDLETLDQLGYGNTSIYSRMASVYLLVKDLPKAETYFLKVKKISPHDDGANYFLALLAEEKKDYLTAARYVQDSASYAQSSKLQLQAAYFLSSAGKSAESLAALASAYRLNPDNVEIGFFYGLALNDDKQFKQAARVWKQVLQNSPSYEQARFHYAFTLAELGRYKEMEEQAKWLLEKNPQNAPILNLWAYVLAEQGKRLEEAVGYAARALAVSPGDAAYIDTLAWIFYKQGKLKEADDILSAIPLHIIERNAEIAYHLGAVRLARGKTEDAKIYLQMAQNEYPPAAKLLRKLK